MLPPTPVDVPENSVVQKGGQAVVKCKDAVPFAKATGLPDGLLKFLMGLGWHGDQ